MKRIIWLTAGMLLIASATLAEKNIDCSDASGTLRFENDSAKSLGAVIQLSGDKYNGFFVRTARCEDNGVKKEVRVLCQNTNTEKVRVATEDIQESEQKELVLAPQIGCAGAKLRLQKISDGEKQIWHYQGNLVEDIVRVIEEKKYRNDIGNDVFVTEVALVRANGKQTVWERVICQ